jgi:hypothetical protein
LLSGILDFSDVARCLFGVGLVGKEKKKNKFSKALELFRANWKNLMHWTETTLGTALDAGERSGPRWTGDAWFARRRRYSTARRDRVIA